VGCELIDQIRSGAPTSLTFPLSADLHGKSPAGQRMRKGFLYLVAIMDWFTRKVLAWRISNTLEAEYCVEALTEAIHKFGAPEIMNTDHGSQFTSFDWTDRLKRIGTRISMDGKARYLDNIFI
jgi:putative transposase